MRELFNRSFARWWAPLVGAIVVPGIMLKGAERAPGLITPSILGIGALCGAAVGLLLMLLDVRDDEVEVRGDALQRFLAICCVAVCWAPCAGLGVSALAILANRRIAAWPRPVSWIGFGLSLCSTGVAAVLMLLNE